MSLLTFSAVQFLASMGLPTSKLKATRKDVESGKLSIIDTPEDKMYSRHDLPRDELESDLQASPVLKKGSAADR